MKLNQQFTQKTKNISTWLVKHNQLVLVPFLILCGIAILAVYTFFQQDRRVIFTGKLLSGTIKTFDMENPSGCPADSSWGDLLAPQQHNFECGEWFYAASDHPESNLGNLVESISTEQRKAGEYSLQAQYQGALSMWSPFASFWGLYSNVDSAPGTNQVGSLRGQYFIDPVSKVGVDFSICLEYWTVGWDKFLSSDCQKLDKKIGEWQSFNFTGKKVPTGAEKSKIAFKFSGAETILAGSGDMTVYFDELEYSYVPAPTPVPQATKTSTPPLGSIAGVFWLDTNNNHIRDKKKQNSCKDTSGQGENQDFCSSSSTESSCKKKTGCAWREDIVWLEELYTGAGVTLHLDSATGPVPDHTDPEAGNFSYEEVTVGIHRLYVELSGLERTAWVIDGKYQKYVTNPAYITVQGGKEAKIELGVVPSGSLVTPTVDICSSAPTYGTPITAEIHQFCNSMKMWRENNCWNDRLEYLWKKYGANCQE